ncbi:hypothetical protein ABPG72_020024 [Tetrahymena utriculariae]
MKVSQENKKINSWIIGSKYQSQIIACKQIAFKVYIWYSDETIFTVDEKKAKIWIKNNEGVLVERKERSYLNRQIHVWCGISMLGRTKVFVHTSSINSDTYMECLEQALLPAATKFYYRRKIKLLQDGARSHTSQATSEFCQENNIDIIQLPAQSPDLNPIENIWGIMKNQWYNSKSSSNQDEGILGLDSQAKLKAKGKKKKNRQKPSRVWKQFTTKGDYDVCNIFRQEYVSCKSTSTLINHLYREHKKKYYYLYPEKQPQTKEQQQPILNFEKISKQKQEEINILISKYISFEMKPINIVESIYFKEFLQYICPNISMPDVKNISTKYIPSLNLTVDMWQSKYNNKSFLTLTCHYLNEEFVQLQWVLKTVEVKEDHSAETFANYIKNILSEYEITIPKQEQMIDEYQGKQYSYQNLKITVTSDRGTNNLKLFNEIISIPHICCYAHILNNAIQQINKINNKENSNIINKVENICKYFRASPQRQNQFELIQSELIKMEAKDNKVIDSNQSTKNERSQNKPLKFKLSNTTRWNSVFLMIERFLMLKKAIQIYLINFEVDKIQVLSDNEFVLLEELCHFLQPFYLVTFSLSSRESSIYKISNQIQKIKTNYLQFSLIHITKKLTHLNKNDQNQTLLLVKNLYEEIEQGLNKRDLTNKKDQQQQDNDSDIFGIPAFSFNDNLTENSEEIRSYQNRNLNPNEEQNFNLFQWWNKNKETYPILSQLARLLLNIQARSVESERIFSKAGHILKGKLEELDYNNLTKEELCKEIQTYFYEDQGIKSQIKKLYESLPEKIKLIIEKLPIDTERKQSFLIAFQYPITILDIQYNK